MPLTVEGFGGMVRTWRHQRISTLNVKICICGCAQ